MRIAVIQLGYDDREPVSDRVTRVAGLVRAQAGHDLVVLPELWAAGGFSYKRWEERAEPVDGPVASAMSAAARDAGVMLHAGSIVERPAEGERGADGKHLWNTSLVFAADGSLAATYRKIHRFGFGQGEPLLMEAGDALSLVDVPDSSPSAGAARAALSTCYDLRFPELYRAQLDAGATLRHTCCLACGSGPALDSARPRPRDREPVRRRGLQHGGHSRRRPDGRTQPGRAADRGRGGHGRQRRAGAQR